MRAATSPRDHAVAPRLLWIDPSASRWTDASASDLPHLLRPHDLLVLNDAATLPASLAARTSDGASIEVRLTGAPIGIAWPTTGAIADLPMKPGPASMPRGKQTLGAKEAERLSSRLRTVSTPGTPGAPGAVRVEAEMSESHSPERRESENPSSTEWLAVVFGRGDWRERTEDREPPPSLPKGARLSFDGGLEARVVAVSAISPRLVTLRFDREGTDLWDALYRAGRPVQYSYLSGPLASWHVQTRYASRPWAAEPPSAGLNFTWGLLSRLRARGVRLAWITEAAGLSSTGDPAIDAALPLPERFEVPADTVRAVEEARAAGGRVIAVGTTVLRALESAVEISRAASTPSRDPRSATPTSTRVGSEGWRLAPCEGITDLRVGPGFERHVVDAILTGVHDPGTSHYALLQSFATRTLLDAATHHAEVSNYLGHEFGDLCLIMAA